MMQFCQTCGNPIQPGDTFCKICYEQELDDFHVVKNYLRTYPNSNAMQIANATGVSVSKILKYIRNGSFTVVGNESSRRMR